MKVVDMSQKDLRVMFRDEAGKMLKDYKKDAEKTFMTRGDCLKVHLKEGRPTNGVGLTKEKIKFWATVTGLILAISGLITALGTVIAQI